MNYCVDCIHSVGEYVNRMIQTPKGPVPTSGKLYLCSKEDFLHPVEKEKMPCMVVRDNERLCGFEGKGFSPKEGADILQFRSREEKKTEIVLDED